MKIIKDQNNVVLFAGDLELTATGLISPDWTAPGITTSTHTSEDVESLPADWVGGHYFYDGEWTLTDLGQAAKDENDLLAAQNIYRSLESAVDGHVGSVAQAKGYDNRLTATMRAGYANPWQAEGIAFGQWMDSCYEYCQGVQADVMAGIRPIPTTQELIAELPGMVWPE